LFRSASGRGVPSGPPGPFEKAFGVDMDTLMRMQNSYDIARTRIHEKKIRVERYKPRPAA
jgi:plasmid maintenance system antidote protein VapI